MEPIEIINRLSAIPGRGPGTDAERRAAKMLAQVLHDGGREAELEPHWVRPQWQLVLAMHAALGIAGSVVSVFAPAVGLGIAGAALVSAVLEALGWAHLLRRFSPPRATQNVVSPPTETTRYGAERIVRLVICAQYDAGRSGLIYRERFRRIVGRAQRVARGRLPGAAGVIALALTVLAGTAGLRLAGIDAGWVGAVQLVPTVALLVSFAALIDIGLSEHGPGASDPAGGVGVAIALAQALDRDPPRRMAVELVLAGAGEGPSLGMRAWVSERRRTYAPAATVVLALAACGHGPPRFWTVDGPLLPLRFHPRLRDLATGVAFDEAHLHAAPHRGHRAGAGFRARARRLPAITIGSVEGDSWAEGSHRPEDEARYVDGESLGAALEFCRALVARLDDDLGNRPTGGAGDGTRRLFRR